jgi:hypothetical protein
LEIHGNSLQDMVKMVGMSWEDMGKSLINRGLNGEIIEIS